MRKGERNKSVSTKRERGKMRREAQKHMRYDVMKGAAGKRTKGANDPSVMRGA